LSIIQHEYINDPKFRWAQQIADRTQTEQALIKNMFGSIDIKPARVVILINNPQLLCIVEPASQRSKEYYGIELEENNGL
jgi:hypothetical protein